jgi:hypothetical protein
MKKKEAGFILAVMLLGANAIFAASASSPVGIEPGHTLHVRIIDMVTDTLRYDRDFKIRGENDRFHILKKSIEDVFEKAELPVVTIIVRSSARLPEHAQVLNIYLHEWELNRIGEYETRLAAQLTGDGVKENLGVKVGSLHWGSPLSYDVTDNFETSARRAVAQLIPELALRISG